MKSRRFKVFIGMFYMLWRHVERCKLQHAKKNKLATRCCVPTINSQQDFAFWSFFASVLRLLRQRSVFTAEILATFYVFRKFFDLQFDATWIVNDGLIPACFTYIEVPDFCVYA